MKAPGIVFVMSLATTACAPPASNIAPPILLFSGTGTSPNDVAAVEAILDEKHLEYSTVNSRQLNGMSESQLMAYRLMIVPGGNFIDMGNSLTPNTTANIHNAVQGGLNYLGICAGGFLAGNASYNSLNLTSGVRFDFYADENRGIRKAAVAISRCRHANARALLGGWPAVYRLGRGRGQVSRRDSRDRRRNVRQGMGDPLRRSS